MPFTLSHPAAVLPFMRRPFVAAALVAGAVAPDMPYFVGSIAISVNAQSWYEPFLNATTSHTLVGAGTVVLPYALALYGFSVLARRPVGALLPALGGSGAPAPAGAGALLRRAGWVLVSLLIGLATHLVWDSFTHWDGYVVAQVPLLSSSLAGSLTWARALQHVSTVGGLVVIAVYLWRRRSWLMADGVPTRSPAALGGRTGLLGVLGSIVVVGAFVNAVTWRTAAEPTATQAIEGMLSDGSKGAGAALAGALFLYTAAWWVHRGVLWLRRRRRSMPAIHRER